jgi:hypothetical protein
MKAAPPKLQSSSQRAVLAILATAGGGIAAMVFFLNPATHHFYPVCQFHRLTGLDCPGCGATRAVYALLHGEWRAALRDNALFVAVLGLLALRGGWFTLNRYCGRANGDFFPAKWLWLLLVVALAFTVLRNLPAFAFLSP